MSNLILLNNLVLLLLLLLLLACCRWLDRPSQPEPPPKAKRSWQLRPRSPKDCLLCCQPTSAEPHPAGDLIPWSQRKSSRGRPKTIGTSGFFCDNPACDDYQVTDETVHALVGDGRRGTADDIQWLRCQACDNRFSQRRHAPMRALKTPARRVAEVVTALAEGVDQAAAQRIFQHHPTTIARWLHRFAALDAPLHQQHFAGWEADYVQLDELKVRVRHSEDEVWLWTALEARSKVILTMRLGPRTQQMAHALIHDLKHLLAPGCIPVFVSDGLRMYFYALTAHFGSWLPPPAGKRAPIWQVDVRLLFAQLIKVKAGYKLKFVRTVVRCGEPGVYRAVLQAMGGSGRVETAFVERLNLTLREQIAPLSRRSWSIADHPESLARHVALGRVYYHFCRPHQSLEDRRKRGRFRSRTPAMAAGVVPRRYTVQELLFRPIQAI